MVGTGVLLVSLSILAASDAAHDIAFGNDDDLSRYVTRPEIRAPLFEVAIYEPKEVTPGYWFIGPYANIIQERHASKYYQACQTGPAIYDGNGELVWSGACMFDNQNSCDFRVFTANGSDYLSSIMSFYPALDGVGRGVILDNSMQVTKTIHTPNTLVPFNMHEFLVLNSGETAMHIVQKTELSDVSHLGITHNTGSGLVVNMGIREFSLRTGAPIFEWWAHEFVDYSTSTYPTRNLGGPYPGGWDWIHLNAIDKNSEGDYLVTARYTDAVYKISGKDGHIIWTLTPGETSSFQLNGFNFSRPHDARYVSSDATSETITLLDNGGCEESKTADVSSALIIHLDRSSEPWKATVTKRWTRPDDGRSEKRGNFQLLPNGNAFVGWSENSYISEHSPDGRTLMEAQFTSERFVTYRAYKFNFTSAPAEPPVLKGFVYGESPERSVSVYYVSWNGATEVASWDFFNEKDEPLGRTPKKGFETMFQQSSRYAEKVYAKAVSADGTVIGRTEIEAIQNPGGWLVGDASRKADGDVRESSRWDKKEL